MAATTPSAGVKGRAGPRKHKLVAELTDRLSRATSVVVTDYRGITVKQLEVLRSTLRQHNIEYVVVKNTLARRAAQAAGVGEFSDALTGPVGLALGYDDVSRPAKLLNDHFRANRRLPLLAGLVEKRLLDARGIIAVAELPSRDELLAQLAGTLQSPLTHLAGALDSSLSTLATCLEAYRDTLQTAA